MQDSPQGNQNQSECAGERLARIFKYNRQYTIDCIDNILPMERIQCKVEYSKNSRYYDKLSRITKKYGIDTEAYVSFCVRKMRISSVKDMLDVKCLMSYATNLKISEQLRDIHDDFVRTANSIADICIENNMSPSSYISELVVNNSLAYEYYNGNISRYYLAGIQNFKELYLKLDDVNKEELSIIYEATDHLKETLEKSFEKYDEEFVPPIGYTEGIIKQKQQTSNKENKLCVN